MFACNFNNDDKWYAMLGVSKTLNIFESILCSQRLRLFDQYSKNRQ